MVDPTSNAKVKPRTFRSFSSALKTSYSSLLTSTKCKLLLMIGSLVVDYVIIVMLRVQCQLRKLYEAKELHEEN